MTPKIRSKKGNTGEYAAPVLMQSCSDLTWVSGWVLWVWRKPTMSLWKMCSASTHFCRTKIQTAQSFKKRAKKGKKLKISFCKKYFFILDKKLKDDYKTNTIIQELLNNEFIIDYLRSIEIATIQAIVQLIFAASI